MKVDEISVAQQFERLKGHQKVAGLIPSVAQNSLLWGYI